MFSFTAIVLVMMSVSDFFEAMGFFALGWSPAAAAFLTILATGGKLTDLGFRKSRQRRGSPDSVDSMISRLSRMLATPSTSPLLHPFRSSP
jgi:hypothetical protein